MSLFIAVMLVIDLMVLVGAMLMFDIAYIYNRKKLADRLFVVINVCFLLLLLIIFLSLVIK